MWIILFHDQTYIGLASALRHAGEIEKAVEALEYAYDNVAQNSMVSESIVSILQDAANNDFKNKDERIKADRLYLERFNKINEMVNSYKKTL